MHVLLVAIIFVALFIFYHLYYKRLGYPPGPTPIPFFGNVFSMVKVERFEYKFLEWKKQYGNVYTYWVGNTPVVAVNDYNLAVKTFVKNGELFANRGEDTDFQKYVRFGKKSGVVFSDGALWQNNRRFSLHFLRDFGLGKNQMQDRIVDEIQYILEETNKDIQSGVENHDFYKKTDIAVGSIINSLLFGYRFTQDGNQKQFYQLKELTMKMVRGVSSPIILLSRFNDRIFNLTWRYCSKTYKLIDHVFNFIDDQIHERVKTEEIDENVEPRDFVDAFLIEKAKQRRLGLPSADFYTLEQLRGIAFDIWFAGQETTTATITWAIAFLINYPDVQQKLHEELDRVIGSDRLILTSDRQELVYLNATIMASVLTSVVINLQTSLQEVQRCANIVAQNLFRQTTQDVEIGGHKVKKSTYCTVQISTIHYDEKIFPEPSVFKPERFLTENGQLKHIDELVPFSMGKRVCLGEGLARMELYLFLSNLFNQYKACF
ncbi:Cytochrome P450 33C9 [Aphelenchoides bicaudatus]|nr:Cytochrome P450 33C9 [Aphelenchoides bicaudatus]